MTTLYLVPEFHDRNGGSLGSRCVDEIGCFHHQRDGTRRGVPRAIRGPDTFKLERWIAEGRSVRSIASELEVSRATVIAEAKRLGLRRKAA